MACVDKKQLVNIDLGGIAKVKNAPNPVNPGDLVNKAYVDAAAAGISAWKQSVDAATVANVNLASPTATIDGFSLVNGSRVLVKDQTTASENGIYIFDGTSLNRASDADAGDELDSAIVTVESGNTNNNVTFKQTTPNVTIGTDNVAWIQFGNSAPAATETVAGIAEIATQAEVDAGVDDARFVTPLKLKTALGGVPVHKHAQLIGDGTNTTYNITHNLGTTDVQVQVFEAASPKAAVITGIEIVDANTVTVCFVTAPALNEYNVVTMG